MRPGQDRAYAVNSNAKAPYPQVQPLENLCVTCLFEDRQAGINVLPVVIEADILASAAVLRDEQVVWPKVTIVACLHREAYVLQLAVRKRQVRRLHDGACQEQHVRRTAEQLRDHCVRVCVPCRPGAGEVTATLQHLSTRPERRAHESLSTRQTKGGRSAQPQIDCQLRAASARARLRRWAGRILTSRTTLEGAMGHARAHGQPIDVCS
eukprot:scaffold2707_cov417-Prasinococcus_capsulatus_cf.AAC.24